MTQSIIQPYRVMEVPAAPRQQQPSTTLPRQHQWFYVLEGAFQFLLQGQTRLLTVGDSLLVPAGVTFSWLNASRGPGRLLCASATGSAPVDPVFNPAGENRLGGSFSVVGTSVDVLLRGADSGNTFSVMHVLTPPNEGPPRHIHHHEDEYFYLLDGEMEFALGEDTVLLRPGQSLVGPRRLMHTFRNVGPRPNRMIVMSFPAGLDEFFRAMHQLSPEQSLPVFERFGLEFAGPPLALVPA